MLVVIDPYISCVRSGTPDFHQAAERDLNSRQEASVMVEDRLRLISH